MAEYSEMTPAIRAELEMWLAADRRHRGAYLRALAGLYAVEDAVIEARPNIPPTEASVAQGRLGAQGAQDEPPGLGQPDGGSAHQRAFAHGQGIFAHARSRFAISAALAASVAAMLLVGWHVLPSSNTTTLASTEQTLTLKDGSIATLSKDAQIEVMLTDEYRRITLVRGEATFKVAHDKSRPFVVRSGDVFAQATGTVYTVQRTEDAGGTVKVAEGSVLVWAREERDHAVQLHAGGELTLKPGPPLPDVTSGASVHPRLPPPELAQISFDNDTIRSAVGRFNRVNSTKIVIIDPKIGDTQIVGLFRANDPEQFAEAAAALTGGMVEKRDGQIVIKLK